MKTINWNQMSELGLIQRINSEILHPLGLAMSRNVESGVSEEILIADDGFWEYANKHFCVLTKADIAIKLDSFIENREYKENDIC